jgi:hypothetical protein
MSVIVRQLRGLLVERLAEVIATHAGLRLPTVLRKDAGNGFDDVARQYQFAVTFISASPATLLLIQIAEPGCPIARRIFGH